MNSAISTAGRTRAYIASVAVASPHYTVTQAQADAFLTNHFSDRLSPKSILLMHRVLSHPSIRQRRFAFERPDCLIEEDPDSRINRFTKWAVELSSQAVARSLERVDLSARDISGLVVNTCTGYICPGLSTYLIEKMGLPRTIRAYDLVGSGCGGAIPNLQLAEALLKESVKGVVVSVSIEICSATFQMADDPGLIISNALFADGAAAAVLWKRAEGLELAASACYYAPEHRDDIRYVHRNGQLYNQIARSLPLTVKKAAVRVVTDLLEPMALQPRDIRHWALHPGGEKIVNEVKEELGLSEAQLRATRSILSGYGNMSSPTVWFVLNELLEKGISPGEWCAMLAFGAGLSAHACLLKKT
ncbi:MAG TPA: 3-oxoacyl-[acyl-carrier-protein] synthase III C-terminal domain-containing protein [Dissulfurispiraceae bacterium]